MSHELNEPILALLKSIHNYTEMSHIPSPLPLQDIAVFAYQELCTQPPFPPHMGISSATSKDPPAAVRTSSALHEGDTGIP